MFPFVGAPMFYSARRRKRKWTLVFCVEGAGAESDVIGLPSPSTSAQHDNLVEEEESELPQESDEKPGTSFDTRGERRRSLVPSRKYDVADVEANILLPLSSTTTSLAMAMSSGHASSAVSNKPRKRRRRCYSLPPRGDVRKIPIDDTHDIGVPSKSAVAIHAEHLFQSSLECLLNQCGNWNFDMFLLNRLSGGLIENGYKNNPYHNVDHSADVAQAMYCFLQERPLSAAVTPFERMSCILAAFGHDLYHPGVNQKFLEGSGHFLCRLYNNVSILENFHWRCLVSIIKESSLFDHLSPENWRQMLNIFEVLILATDMQRQQEYLNQFKAFLCSHTCSDVMDEPRNRLQLMQPYVERGGQPHLKEASERLFVMQILIKCADIANPCRPWAVCKEWSARVSSEFFNQGDQERSLGLPVTNFCDRYATSIPKIQSGFMEYVAQPLFADWDQYMRSPLSSYMLRNLRSNCQNWNKMLREQVQQQQQQLQEQQEQQKSRSASPASSGAGVKVSPHHPASETSSLEEMAELEMQKPDVLQKRRASSSAVIRSRSPRASVEQPRRVSLPVSTSGGATLWTASANRRIYETISTSDISNAPVKLQLLHSEVTEEEDEDPISYREKEDSPSDGAGACSGSGCGTPTPPPPSIVVSTSATEDWPMGNVVYSVVDKTFRSLMTAPSQHQQHRRYSEPVVLTLANFCSVPAKNSKPKSKPSTDENGRLSNLLLQHCMPRRGSLPMTQKELEDVHALSTLPLAARSNSSGPSKHVPGLNRAVDVS